MPRQDWPVYSVAPSLLEGKLLSDFCYYLLPTFYILSRGVSDS